MVKINPSEAIYGDNRNVNKQVDDKKKTESFVMQGYGGEFNPMDGLSVERTEPKTDKTEPVDDEKGGLTLNQVKEARNNGKLVAEFLGGYTNKLEQEKVKEIILEKVNPENILEFLKSYVQNKSFTTDKLFEQLESEWGFEEAQNLMKKLAGDLKAYCEKHHDKHRASEIALILMENGFSKEDAERLDQLSQI